MRGFVAIRGRKTCPHLSEQTAANTWGWERVGRCRWMSDVLPSEPRIGLLMRRRESLFGFNRCFPHRENSHKGKLRTHTGVINPPPPPQPPGNNSKRNKRHTSNLWNFSSALLPTTSIFISSSQSRRHCFIWVINYISRAGGGAQRNQGLIPHVLVYTASGGGRLKDGEMGEVFRRHRGEVSCAPRPFFASHARPRARRH